jgi:chromosome segregation ATPase
VRKLLYAVPLLWLTIAVLLGLVIWQEIRSRPEPTTPPAVAARQDSIERTRPGADRAIDSLKTSAAEAEARSRRAEARARAEEDSTRSAKGRADSLARVAAESKTAADSATYYRQAYAERTAEAEGLRRSLASREDALTESYAASARLAAAADSADRRRKVVEDQNLDLTRALKKAAKKDKLLGLIPLPSRTSSFLVGVGVGGVTYALVADLVDKGR